MPDFQALITAITDPSTTLPRLTQGSMPLRSNLFPPDIFSPEEMAVIQKMAGEILDHPLAMQHLCDRVYALLQQDIEYQRERSQSHH